MKDNHKNLKRFLTFLLCLAMIITYMPTSLMAYAEGEPAEQTVTEEAAPETKASEEVQAEEPAQPEEVKEEAAPSEEVKTEEKEEVKADKPDTKADTAGTETKAEEKAEEAKADEAEADEAEADEAEADEKPAGSFGGKYTKDLKEVEVKVDTADDAFAEEVSLVVKKLDEKTDKKEFKEAEKALAENEQTYSGILAFDIHFENADGKEIEPKGAVSVSMKAKKEAFKDVDPEAFDADSVQVTHIADKAEVVADTDDKSKVDGTVDVTATKKAVTGVEASFEVDSFSTFVLTWGDGQKATIHFGTMTGTTFNEFDKETITFDTTASNFSVAKDFEGYYYSGAVYCTGEQTIAQGIQMDSVIHKNTDGSWTLTKPATEDSEATTVTIANGSNIYATYFKPGEPNPSGAGDDKIPSPTTKKTVTPNGDGTYTIQLDVKGATVTEDNSHYVNVLVVLDATRSMNGTKWTNAKAAMKTLVETLCEGENAQNAGKIDFALVTFGRAATVTQNWTKDNASFKTTCAGVDMVTTSGTNWEAGMRGALYGVLNNMPDDDPTYVIFLTDGDPNVYYSSGSDSNYTNTGTTNGYNANSTTSANHSADEAKSIAAKTKLYGIYCGDSGTTPSGESYNRLVSVITGQGQGGQKTIAANADTIEREFKLIAETALKDIGANNVSVDDGIPQLASVSSQVVDGTVGGYKYYKKAKDEDDFTEWADAPGASFNDENGVTWDLSEVGTLEAETTYRVEFTVWPSQEALDTIADLNNGKITMTDEELEAEGIAEKDGVYTLKTNTHLNTTYTFKDNTYTDEPDELAQGAMLLPTETISLKKNWPKNMLDEYGAATYRDENGEEHTATEITLTVTKDGKDYLPVKVEASNDWEKDDIYISCGFMTVKDGVIDVKETGHDYTVTEPAAFSYYWDLFADVYHPMVINGTTTMLLLVDSKDVPEDMGDKQVYTKDGVTYYLIGGKVYKATSGEGNTLEASNYRRSNLNLTKVVDGTNYEDDTFEYTVKVTDAKSSDGYVWFSAWDPKTSATVKDSDWVVSGATAEEGNTGYWKAENGATVTFKIKAGWNVRFLNLYHGTTYEITEAEKTGYTLASVAGSTQYTYDGEGWNDIKTGTVNPIVKGTIDKPNNSYTLTYTNTKQTTEVKVNKIWNDSDNQDGYRPESITVQILNGANEVVATAVLAAGEDGTWTHTFTGLDRFDSFGNEITYKKVVEIVSETVKNAYTSSSGNTWTEVEGGYADAGTEVEDGEATITNTHTKETTSVTVTKSWEDNDDQDGIRPPSVSMQLYANGTASGDAVTLNAGNNWTYTWDNLDAKSAGTAITYTVDEPTTPTGYTKSVGDVTGSAKDGYNVTVTNKHDVEKTSVPVKKIWVDNDNANETRPSSVTFQLYADGEEVSDKTITLPVSGATGDDDNTWNGTFTNLDKFKAGKEIKYTVKELNGTSLDAGGKLPGEKGSSYTVSYEDDTTVKNTLGTVESDEIKVTKKLTGRAWKDTDEFTFTISASEPETAPPPEKPSVVIKGTDESKTASFGKIKYDHEGTYTYKIVETKGSIGGVTYDEEEHTVTVVVTSNADGTLATSVSYDEDETSLTVENTYAATGSTTFEGTKTIDGRDMTEDDVFTFEIKEGDDVVASVQNDAEGKIAYPKISYTLDDVGTHTYTVKETSTDGAGITVATTEYTVTVTVSDNGDGTLKVEASDNAKELDFINTYAATGSTTFAGTKSIDSRDLATGESFTFQITEGEKTWTATSDDTGAIAFPEISYTLADVGEHTYTVKETSTDGNGITVDTNTYTVTVTVTDNGDGSLKVEASDNAKALDFVNTYEAKGEITFEGTKTLEGRDLTDDDQFTFEVSEDGTENVWTVKNDGSGKIDYPTISYVLNDDQDDTGEHTYTVKETSTNGKGITVATNTYSVTVTVTDPKTGKLNIEVSGDDAKELNFINKYAASGEVTFEGQKTLEGRALTADDVFEFEIKEGDKVVGTGRNDITGKIVFDKLSYSIDDKGNDDLGTHTYTVSETSKDGKGITVATNTYTVTVDVSDNGDGSLKVEPSDNAKKLDFVNTYAATNSVTFEGKKSIEGRDITEDDVFTFSVTEGDKEVATGTSDKTGKITYSTINYTLADVGEHTYTVKETSTNGKGITVDTNTYTVKVTVTDNGDGTLKVEPTENYTALDFVNTYKATGSTTFEGTKTIEGRDMTEDDVFTFEIKEGEKSVGTATNDSTGKIAYPTINYTLADVGEHTYTVKETSTNGKGITVDTNSYEVTVTVSDNGDGTLKVEASDNAKKLDFVNTYKATGDVTFEGTKTIDGRDMTEDDVFTFEIKEGETVVGTAKNDSTGKIAYPKISYTLADVGEHTYTVKETSTDGAGITVDTNSYEVTVTVSDNGDGTLNVVASSNAKSLDFVNTYAATGSTTFAGTKSIDSRDLLEGETYTFSITEGEKTWTATSDDTGAITFPEISYTLADLGKHTYTVKETSTDGNGITVDTNTYTVTVTVTDNGDGTLKVEASDNAKKLDFVNTYEADGEITFNGTKTLNGRDLTEDDKFTFEVSEDGTQNKWTATNDKTGKITYPTITYHHDKDSSDIGKHTYTVKETSTDGNGITVDTKTYTVIIDVADGGYGKLVLTPTGADKDKLDFINEYSAKGKVTFEGQKTLEGRALTADDVFEFEVKEGDKVVGTATNDANGNIVFPEIEYSHDSKESDIGKHTYTVSETSKDGKGITVATNTYTVTVDVSDNGDGSLKVEPSKNFKSLDFVNTYEAKGEVTFEGTKDFLGRERTDKDIFTFEIKEGNTVVGTAESDVDGNISYPTISYVLNNETDNTGIHVYTIAETSKDGKGITVDTNVYSVTVKVSDNGDGTLKVEPTENYTALDFVNTYEAKGTVTFEGTKTIEGRDMTEDDVFTFEVKEGDDVVASVQNDAEGKIAYPEIEYVVNKDGSDVGTHTYTITEKFEDGNGLTAVTEPYTVTVEVSDNGDGTLKIEPSDNYKAVDFENDYEATGTLDFNGLKTLLYGDLADQEFEFELVQVQKQLIFFEKEVQLETVTVGGSDEGVDYEGDDSSAEFKFSQITFTKNKEKDETGEYKYIIREVVPEDAMNADGIKYKDATDKQKEAGGFEKGNYRYDSHEQEITVTVTDNGNGTLEVKKDPAASAGKDVELTNVKAYTELEITKDLKNFVEHEGVNEVTLAFRVVDKETGGDQFSAAAGITFTKAEVLAGNPKTVTVNKIPTDIPVEVTEVYASNFKADPVTVELKLDSDGIYKASFENTYDNIKYNSGAINEYTKGEDGKYTGQRKSPGDQTEN